MHLSSITTARRSIRLPDYDYSRAGMYFFTICTYKRQLLFGNVANGDMKLNELGRLVFEEWRKSANIRRELELDTFIVMPNHIHGIVMLKNLNAPTARQISKRTGDPPVAPTHDLQPVRTRSLI